VNFILADCVAVYQVGMTTLTFKAYWLRDAPRSLTFNNCTLCPNCIFVFCIYL